MTRSVFGLISISALLLTTNCVLAAADVRVSGFGTIGAVISDSREFGYRADFSKTGGVFKDDLDFAETTNLGIQFDIAATSKIDIVIQGVYRDQKDLSIDSALNLAFIRYAPNANWSFRAGRTAYDAFLLTEYRDIGYAYAWAHVPTEIYGVTPYRYTDGIDVTYSRPIKGLMFSAKVFYGKTEFPITAFSEPTTTESGFDNIVGLALDFQSINWDIAFNGTRLKIDSQAVKPLVEAVTQLDTFVPNFSFIWPNAVEFINAADLDNRDASYLSISGQYRFDNVTVISELARSSTDSLSLQSSNMGYLSGIYHNNAHNYFAAFAFSKSDAFTLVDANINLPALSQIPGGMQLYDASERLLNYYRNNQKTLSLGWRWDFAANVSFTLQLDHTELTQGGSTFWQPPEASNTTANRTGRVNVLFANMSFLY